MSEARLERCRASYRCNRSFILVPWPHCDCRGCAFARTLLRNMQRGLAPNGQTYAEWFGRGGQDWYADAEKP